jgi:DNA-binding CsgD family transcriptional regulator
MTVEGDPLYGKGEVEPLLRVAHARLFRSSVWLRVGEAFHLSPCERRIGMLLADGKGPSQIEEILGVSAHMVAYHLRNMRFKLGLPVEEGDRRSSHRVTARLLLAAVGYLDHGLPGESDGE